MSLLSIASAASRQRGYMYFQQKKVLRTKHLGDMRFQASVAGSLDVPYTCIIDLEHPRKSSCNCPHAADKRIICKHMVATYFAVFPEEAEIYYAQELEAEEEAERYQEELYEKLVKFVYSLKKAEAQSILLELLEKSPEWLLEDFIQDYIGY